MINILYPYIICHSKKLNTNSDSHPHPLRWSNWLFYFQSESTVYPVQARSQTPNQSLSLINSFPYHTLVPLHPLPLLRHARTLILADLNTHSLKHNEQLSLWGRAGAFLYMFKKCFHFTFLKSHIIRPLTPPTHTHCRRQWPDKCTQLSPDILLSALLNTQSW